MSRSSVLPKDWSMADLLEQLGDISPRRVRLNPPPGRATEKDVIAIHDRTDRLYELVDGVLVEKVMGFPESFLALEIGRLLGNYVTERDLGIVAGEAGMLRLLHHLVRIPDVSFISWDRLPNREVPADPIPDLAPDLAVEVLSESNTEKEMQRKLKEYFLAGVQLVWYVDPQTRTVDVYTAPDRLTRLTGEQTLTGGDVLPGLALPLQQVFARMPRLAEKPSRRREPLTPTKGKARNKRK
jgi:Uma2 family endonuclease